MNRKLVIVGGLLLVVVIGIAIFLRARIGGGAVNTQRQDDDGQPSDELHADSGPGARLVIRLTRDPTTTTAITPIGLCQRNEMRLVAG